MPPNDLELSTFNTDDLGSTEIWALGEEVRIEGMRDKLYGRADVSASEVYRVKLRPLRDDHPPQHVLIVDWPSDKALQKYKAQLLAHAASFVPPE
jgi:hypothetical protein